MLSKIVKLGDRLELRAMERKNPEEAPKIYYSKIYDILSEDSMEITMPMEQTKLILLPVDKEYDLVLYTESGLYQCLVRIADRYKSNNVYILQIELISNLQKHQRREYYRFSCALEMCSRELEEEELQAVENNEPYVLQPELPLRRSVIVDISGGGLRFMSEYKYEAGSMIYCNYHLMQDGDKKLYKVVGKVLAARELPNRKGTYEHRVQYINIDEGVREQIIKFIFEEERKNRRKERNL